MTRKPRRPAYVAGHYYHIYNRGRSRLFIFHEDDNYVFVLRKMKKYAREFNLTLIAYCLMPNHYHFLIRQESDSPAGLLSQRVFNSYSKAFNRRYDHSGTLFEGHYKVREVNTDAYLLHLCRYIHANPVKDGLVEHLEEWPYSNYHEWVSLREGTLIDRDFVSERFPSPAQYEAFVLEYLRDRLMPDELAYLEN